LGATYKAGPPRKKQNALAESAASLFDIVGIEKGCAGGGLGSA